ncbi:MULTISPECIES: TonB-dependent siderophore receptor [Luteimonas]|uniref:TonB-dependent siderophore receptor n=1 Tax=Luteimonas TaxID=83614 RepID=UPI000C7E3A00|nr:MULTISPECIES: TonB-dependent siderophore receptor [Luteimonas]
MSVRPLHPARAVPRALLSTAIALSLSPVASAQSQTDDDPRELDTVHVTAEAIARQALGTSVITVEDIERRPPANDLAELIRTMPGVNLTGNSSSGQYGNNRQIDLRGMGPENTLILVDGKPVGSRDSIRMGRSGERNTRGDTNWVPAEAVERIEVLRGPAAARYGSGASGGVVNIITKRPTGDLTGSLSLYGLVPQHGEEGGSHRAGVTLSGPLTEALSFRVYGNVNKTEADSLDLNSDFLTDVGVTPPAGREGVRNRDVNALLRWDVNAAHVLEFEAGTSRQGNLYAGDRAVSLDGTPLLTELAEAGAETNRMYRNSGAITHRGVWGDASSRLTLGFEGTNNKRLNEGLAGGPEGSIGTATAWSTSRLRNASIDGEVNLPTTLGTIEHVWTVGFEHRDSELEDPYSVTQSGNNGGGIPGLDPDRGGGRADAQTSAVFVEDNIYAGERWIVTPGVRFDHHSQFGNNLSPSLNVQFALGDDLKLKGGVARAFKAPNLYQSNPNYLYYTMGFGCPDNFPSLGSGCYILGNDALDAETSLNKEIGIEWAPLSGYHASLTYFHNDYEDKIVSGVEPVGQTPGTPVVAPARIFRWENAPDAVVQGLEGNINVPLLGDAGDVLKWTNNLTYMIENENTLTGQPLSVIPEYTVNTALDWQATDALSLLLTGTFYGRQEPATRDMNNDDRCDEVGADCTAVRQVREAYNVWGIGARYRITDTVSLGGGVNNLFDKRLFRESNSSYAGAATYNEPGRAYYVSMNIGF